MANRKPVIAGNWKANLRLESARELCAGLRTKTDGLAAVEQVVCPPFIYLAIASEALKGSFIKVGGQDVHWQDDVAATGEIGPRMLAELADYVIIGHSERRHVFGETDEAVNLKVTAALTAGLKPILCVGETLAEREAGRTEDVLRLQIEAGLRQVDLPDGFIIAYEPVWAIGTGKAATPEMANNTIGAIRTEMASQCGTQLAATARILYGGSVDAANITELMAQVEIDGALVGGASLHLDKFSSIILQAAAQIEGA